MPDQDPFAAIARPIVPPKANPDPYASIAKPIDPYASIAKPINFDDLGGRRVSAPTSQPVGSRQSGGIDFSDLGGRRVAPPAKPLFDMSKAKPIDSDQSSAPIFDMSKAVPIPQGATLQPLNSAQPKWLVQAPDGKTIQFPDEFQQADVEREMNKMYPAKSESASDDQPGVLSRYWKVIRARLRY